MAARFAERIEMSVAPLPDTDRQLLAQLAAQIVAADADHRGASTPAGNGHVAWATSEAE